MRGYMDRCGRIWDGERRLIKGRKIKTSSVIHQYFNRHSSLNIGEHRREQM